MNPPPNAGVRIDRRDARVASRYVVAVKVEDDYALRRRNKRYASHDVASQQAVILLDCSIAENWAVNCQIVRNAVNGDNRAGWANNAL